MPHPVLSSSYAKSRPHDRTDYRTALCVVDGRGCAVEFRLWRLGTLSRYHTA